MKSKILFVLPFLPWPMRSGGHQAIFNGILCLDGFADIYITYPASSINEHVVDHQEQLRNKIRGIKGIFPYVPQKRDWSKRKYLIRLWNKLIRGIFPLSHDEAFMEREGCIGPANMVSGIHDQGYYENINSIIRENNIDIVQVEMLTELDAVLAVPQNVKKVFVHHELGYVRKEMTLVQQGCSFLRQAYVQAEKAKELFFLNLYDLVITLSEGDKNKLENNGVKTKISPSFAVVTSVKSSCSTFPYNFNGVLTFIGPESHTPNKLGLEWFLDNVWGRLKENHSTYRMHIIGLWSDETIKIWSSKYEDVVFRGFVDDLSKELLGSTMVVPIFVGSGIRMKILEAMSIGVPFVSTSVGAEGIPVKDKVNCYITDAADIFVEDIINLSDENLRRQFVNSSKELVSTYFSFERFKEDRILLYQKLLDN